MRPSRAAEAGDEDRRAPRLPDVVPAAARRERHPRHRTRRQARRRRGQGHVAALASAWKLSIHPHTSMTGLNMAATIHFLAAIDNGGYFEADVSKGNLFRDRLTSAPYTLDTNGCVAPLEKPGLGVEVDEDFLVKHPVIEGPAYV
ncbi:MAG: hypothetical protein DME14_12820 [Candidatus Rokuibacteriota bacterium]|nr:MAG: hypothetical protein DME14_12820 [Candidatus Rokubacteria bacterium]